MNRHYISRFVLMIVLLLGVCAKGWADGETVIFSEDNFSSFPNAGYNEIDYNGWKLKYAKYRSSLDGLLLNGGSSYTAYLETPSLGLNGTATLSFEFLSAVSNPTNLNFSISISGAEFDEFDGNVNVTKNTYVEKTVNIKNATSATKIKFIKSGSNGLFLKNVKIRTSTYTLSQSWNNSYALNAQKGNTVDVTLGRTFPANTWCTLCLPFDVTASSIGTACGTDAPRLRVFSSVVGNTMKFTEPTGGAVSAGTPFLLKFATAVTSNPVFNGVTISKTGDAVTPAETVKHGGCSFIGTYSPVSIGSTGCFLNSDGQLCHPKNDGNTNYDVLPGLRAYFILPTTASGARPVVSIAGDDATTVGAAASVAPSVEAIYTLGGLPVASPKSPGIYIVRRTDGSTQKVTIR